MLRHRPSPSPSLPALFFIFLGGLMIALMSEVGPGPPRWAPIMASWRACSICSNLLFHEMSLIHAHSARVKVLFLKLRGITVCVCSFDISLVLVDIESSVLYARNDMPIFGPYCAPQIQRAVLCSLLVPFSKFVVQFSARLLAPLFAAMQKLDGSSLQFRGPAQANFIFSVLPTT